MNYTLAHLKIAHYIGTQNVPFEETVETIALLNRNGLIDTDGRWSIGPERAKGKSGASQPAEKQVTKRRKRRGSLSKKIIQHLQTKGTAGAHVKDLALALKAQSGNVTAWFYGTGKSFIKSGEIKKIAPATFAYFKPKKAD